MIKIDLILKFGDVLHEFDDGRKIVISHSAAFNRLGVKLVTPIEIDET